MRLGVGCAGFRIEASSPKQNPLLIEGMLRGVRQLYGAFHKFARLLGRCLNYPNAYKRDYRIWGSLGLPIHGNPPPKLALKQVLLINPMAHQKAWFLECKKTPGFARRVLRVLHGFITGFGRAGNWKP